MLEDFPEEITETLETPAASKILNVRDNNEQELLDKTRYRAFHHTVAQLIFTGIRCRNDAQTTIYFLTTIVMKLDEDNCKKLRRLPRYLKITIKLPLIPRANEVNVLNWWVDASYTTHDNMRGLTVGTM